MAMQIIGQILAIQKKKLIPCDQPNQKSQLLYFDWPVQLPQSPPVSSLKVPFPGRKKSTQVNLSTCTEKE